MTNSTHLPTEQSGRLPLTKWKTQAYGIASPNALYLRLYNKESNTSIIAYQLIASQFHQMKKMLPYIHMEGGMFLPWVEEGGRRKCGKGEHL